MKLNMESGPIYVVVLLLFSYVSSSLTGVKEGL